MCSGAACCDSGDPRATPSGLFVLSRVRVFEDREGLDSGSSPSGRGRDGAARLGPAAGAAEEAPPPLQARRGGPDRMPDVTLPIQDPILIFALILAILLVAPS